MSWLDQEILNFGRDIGRVDLAGIVIDFYDSAIQPASRNQYNTGQRAYLRFVNNIKRSGYLLPFPRTRLSKTELMLAFFMASLFLKPSISRAATILNYETHVKWMWRKETCHPHMYNTPFLRQVRAGLKKILPSPKDRRSAFILPQFMTSRSFNMLDSADLCFLRFFTIIGFVGMLRPHTFPQLCPHSFTLVVKDKYSPAFSSHISATDARVLHHALRLDQQRYTPIGFYIRFRAKTQEDARAYFPNLKVPATHYSNMCPVDALRILVSKGM